MMAIVAWICLATTAPALDGPATLIPAYAHNDYRNRRPLYDALEMGFRGVEVDYFLIDGELRVGHERDETRAGRTIESMYLAPLREIVQRCGGVLPGGETFILNVESKMSGQDTYDALHELLSEYEDMLTVVRDGVEYPGAVQVILVGWHPPLDYLAAQPVRYVAVQCHYRSLPAGHERYPGHLLKLLSQKYNDKLLIRTGEPVSPRLQRRLDKLNDAARAVPGRLVRVYNVPTKRRVYEALLASGVDLIGTKDIAGAHRLLTDMERR
jgi:glycerophosphoryl diester phosphodiesterase